MQNKDTAGMTGLENISGRPVPDKTYTDPMAGNIRAGMILADLKTSITDPPRYRVLHIKHPFAVLCKMDTSKIDIFLKPLNMIMDDLETGDLTVTKEETPVFDPEKLPEKMKISYERNREIINAVTETYGPDFVELSGKKSKPLYDELSKTYGLSKRIIRYIIRVYLQGGMAMWTLVDKRYFYEKRGYGAVVYTRKTGSPYTKVNTGKLLDQRDLEIFAEALKWYKSGRVKSVKKTFDLMNARYYRQIIENPDGSVTKTLLPADQRPSERQLQYYIKQHTTKEEMDRIRTSRMEQRNDKRLLLSDTRYRISGPCDRVQIDEVEVDLFIRSSIKEDVTVGRPIVYIMYDVYSGIVLACGVGFENNSVLGFTNCMLNLSEDKVDYCRRYGIEITPRMWPSCVLPKRLTCDRGSEYRSKEVKRICNELNISLEFVPKGTGSMKGNVEQFFHQMHTNQNPFLEGNGLIEKRHDSTHKKMAMLTLPEFTKLLLNFIVHHNNTQLADYPLTKDMIAKDISPVPVNLWEYGCTKYGSPMSITDHLQYYYTLMLPQREAVYDRRGIRCNGLFYCDAADPQLLTDMYNAQDRRIPFDIRIDPRDVGAVYYIRDGVFHKASLMSTKTGQSDFAGLTLAEWMPVKKYLVQKRREREIADQDYDAYLAEINDMIVKNASRRNITDDSNLLENRREEKNAAARENAMLPMLTRYLLREVGGLPDKYQSMEEEELFEDEGAEEVIAPAETSGDPTDDGSGALPADPDDVSSVPEDPAPDVEKKRADSKTAYEEFLRSIESFPEGYFYR